MQSKELPQEIMIIFCENGMNCQFVKFLFITKKPNGIHTEKVVQIENGMVISA